MRVPCTGWDGGKKATKPPSALGVPRPSTEWLLILPPDLSSNASDALRAARADDRLYDPLCLNRLERVISPFLVNTHGDILVSNASTHTSITFIRLPAAAAERARAPRTEDTRAHFPNIPPERPHTRRMRRTI